METRAERHAPPSSFHSQDLRATAATYRPTRSSTAPCDGTVAVYRPFRTDTALCAHRSRTVFPRGSTPSAAKSIVTAAESGPRLNAAIAYAPLASGRVQISFRIVAESADAHVRLACLPSGS